LNLCLDIKESPVYIINKVRFALANSKVSLIFYY